MQVTHSSGDEREAAETEIQGQGHARRSNCRSHQHVYRQYREPWIPKVTPLEGVCSKRPNSGPCLARGRANGQGPRKERAFQESALSGSLEVEVLKEEAGSGLSESDALRGLLDKERKQWIFGKREASVRVNRSHCRGMAGMELLELVKK